MYVVVVLFVKIRVSPPDRPSVNWLLQYTKIVAISTPATGPFQLFSHFGNAWEGGTVPKFATQHVGSLQLVSKIVQGGKKSYSIPTLLVPRPPNDWIQTNHFSVRIKKTSSIHCQMYSRTHKWKTKQTKSSRPTHVNRPTATFTCVHSQSSPVRERV